MCKWYVRKNLLGVEFSERFQTPAKVDKCQNVSKLGMMHNIVSTDRKPIICAIIVLAPECEHLPSSRYQFPRNEWSIGCCARLTRSICHSRCIIFVDTCSFTQHFNRRDLSTRIENFHQPWLCAMHTGDRVITIRRIGNNTWAFARRASIADEI